MSIDPIVTICLIILPIALTLLFLEQKKNRKKINSLKKIQKTIDLIEETRKEALQYGKEFQIKLSNPIFTYQQLEIELKKALEIQNKITTIIEKLEKDVKSLKEFKWENEFEKEMDFFFNYCNEEIVFLKEIEKLNEKIIETIKTMLPV